jgi:AraC-like DNA-binding protein
MAVPWRKASCCVAMRSRRDPAMFWPAHLRAARPGEVTVAEVAAKWGFWHLGRFASTYRATFGELPSQSLRH